VTPEGVSSTTTQRAGSAPISAVAYITQEELGAHVNIDPTYVSRVEGGRINLRWATLQRFLRAIDATLADLAAEVERRPVEKLEPIHILQALASSPNRATIGSRDLRGPARSILADTPRH
jgi:transcriptional regulator with XRE-family HTH domain